MFEEVKTVNLLDLNRTIAKDLFADREYPWSVLPHISDFIIKLGNSLNDEEYEKRGEDIWVSKSAVVAESAYLKGPLIIDSDAEIRHCAFIRGSAIIGKNAVVGNSTEIKNSVLFNGVQVPHYNYVGDSVLGYKAHMGAGVLTSNVKGDKSEVKVKVDNRCISTGLIKFGAVIGDYGEIGCSSVLNPGSVIGRNCQIYPLSMVRGYIGENSIYKNKNEVVTKE